MLIAPTIVPCGKLTLGLADALLKDVPADRFARLPQGANGPVQTNHPAFVYGHLGIYPARVLAMIGITDHPGYAVPEDQAALLSPGAVCVDDPDASVYPAMDLLIDRFRTGYAAMIAAVESAGDEALGVPTPDERYRERFPTVGVLLNFMLNDHLMFHLGQMSAWRRIEGLGSAM